MSPFIENNELQKYANIWSSEAIQKHSHVRPNGEMTKYGEVLLGGSVRPGDTPKQIASEILNRFIYNDSVANWRHRDLLLNGNYNQMGCGFTINTNTSDKYAAAYDFVANFY